ncbi:UNVERIFIED_ORG: hypothetical protein LHJ69_16365 [Shinella sp. XGS7]|nr:hypothetical protein [Shinella sp. XGS7]
MKHALLVFVAILVSFGAWAQNSNPRVDCARAEKELDRGPFRSWQQVYAYFKRYKGLCSDGAQAEALSAYMTRLLDREWSRLEELKRLGSKDPAFLDWVLLGVFYDPEDIDINPSNTACRLLERMKDCSPENRHLCEQLAQRVGPNREYVQACPPA